MSVNRRRFLAAAGLPALAFGTIRTEAIGAAAPADDRTVRLGGDGLGLTPAQYAAPARCVCSTSKAMTPDSYSLGGIVEQLENAVRAGAGQGARDLHADRHACEPHGGARARRRVEPRDRPGAEPLLSGRGRLRADAEQPHADAARARAARPSPPTRCSTCSIRRRPARVVSRVSVIAVETPVRRKQGEQFDAGPSWQKIVALAQREGIRLHLDGARLFLQAAYTGEDVAAYAKPFDTVYVSLYKYFNAASGAILAGPRDVHRRDVPRPADVRRRAQHGVAIRGRRARTIWTASAIATHQPCGCPEDWIRGLQRHDAFAIERIPSGTNLFRLRVRGTDPAALQKRLAARGIMLTAPQGDAFLVGVNETLNRTTASELTDAFTRALCRTYSEKNRRGFFLRLLLRADARHH